MKTIREETLRGKTLRLLRMKEGYAGLVLEGRRQVGPFYGNDPDDLWLRLKSEQAKADPLYFGYDGAIRRLRHIFPEGLADPLYVTWERQYKIEAKQHLDGSVPVDRARTATLDDCIPVLRAFQKTNLLSQFEKARVSELLKSANGPAFIQAAAAFADDNIRPSLTQMEHLMRRHGQPSWPAATYLSFLWRPDRHMFLKPEATIDFARRVGHSFADDYSSELSADVYESLLDLATEADRAIADLRPRDRIDTQSFIWIVGKYTDGDIADVHAAMNKV